MDISYLKVSTIAVYQNCKWKKIVHIKRVRFGKNVKLAEFVLYCLQSTPLVISLDSRLLVTELHFFQSFKIERIFFWQSKFASCAKVVYEMTVILERNYIRKERSFELHKHCSTHTWNLTQIILFRIDIIKLLCKS